jgi:uncharacterized beta barrel domain-containing protein DUF5777
VIRLSRRLFAALAIVVAMSVPSFAQDDDDAVLKPAEPDFALLSLPTSLRLPVFKSSFRLTHRFGLALKGDFGDLAGDLFGLDDGATVGIEYRIGIIKNGQVGFHRSSNGKTIEFFGQYGVLRQRQAGLDISVLASTEGTNNFKSSGSRSPALGAIVSRTVNEWAAFYVEPVWVNNSNPLPTELVDDNDTFMVGLGTRIRIRPTIYLVAEGAPRVSGFDPGSAHASFGIEKRAGGHVFQLNFSDSRGTTMGQIARGGVAPREWYLGFNLSRKFF